ncbi:MAG: CotH kinase family protein [Clostridia bacterium]|nr:CotH kinase family protein [Clostridia bacterium]
MKKIFSIMIIMMLLVSLYTVSGSAAVPETPVIAYEEALDTLNDEYGAAEADYETGLFDTNRVHTIDVRIAESDWQDLLTHPEEKTKYKADIVIDGESVEQVSFSAKGNSSLAIVKYSGSSTRYSFKLNFGKGIKGQTFHGLDKLNLQNCFGDASYMKEYLSYWLFRQMGVPAPLAAYGFLSINGEAQGLYVLVEEVDRSFMNRSLDGTGALYKPSWPEHPLDEERLREIKSGIVMEVSGAHGADLVYTDDKAESYPDIFDHAVTKRDPESEQRVIHALKELSEGKDPGAVLDTDEIIRYFAVHNVLMNYDSYTGQMLHNYYLYDSSETLQFLPWDYNLGFGTFPLDAIIGNVNNPDLVVNQGIDTPLVRTSLKERPMWNWIVSDETYLARYHEAMEQLITDQFESGAFFQEADRVQKLITPYIEQDPTAFYTPEEAEKACETLKDLSALRAESIRRQLNGTLAADTDLQDPTARVDASGIDLLSLGSFEVN